MRGTKSQVGRPLLASLLVTFVATAAASLVIQSYYDEYVAKALANDYPLGGVSIMILSPGTAILNGIFFSILLVVHWWLSGLFCYHGASSRIVANAMLVVAGVCSLLWLFERGAMDFGNFSLFCKTSDPTVVRLVDEVHRCERSMMLSDVLTLLALLLPILAIPVRILETRFTTKTA